MNLFQSILDKAQGGYNYLSSGQLGASLYDATHNEDPTQTAQYKLVQGGADLFTGIKTRLQETAQEDIQAKQVEQNKKANEFANYLANKGYSKEQIFSALDGLQKEGKLTVSPNFSERLVGGLGQRMEILQTGTERLAGEQNLAKRMGAGSLFYGGNAVATPFEPVSAALQPVVEPVLKPVMESKIGQSALGYAQQFDKENPIASLAVQGVGNLSQLAPVPFVKPVGKAIITGTEKTGKAIVQGAENVAPKVVQGVKNISKTPQAIGQGLTTGAEYSTSLATGLSREAQQTIKSSPALYKEARLGNITAQGELANFVKATETRLNDLSELGKGYESIKVGNKVASVDDITNAYVKATEGVRDTQLTKADRLVLKDANDYMSQLKGQLDETDVLGLRRQLDSIMYDPNTGLKRKISPTGERIVNSMRAEIDKIAKERIPGLKELDAQYGPEVALLKDVKKQIYDANGNIKPTALSTISNIVGKNKDFKLEQFQKIYPELGARIKALKAFEEVQSLGEIKTGSVIRQGGAIAAGSAVAPGFGTIVGWMATNPYVVARVLELYGVAKSKISEILKKGNKVSPKEAEMVQKAVKSTSKAQMSDIINNLSYDAKADRLTSGTIGPTKFNTLGQKKKVITPQSVVAGERGYTTAIKKPIVKRASDASMETKRLIPKDYKYIKKYGASSNDINIDARKGLNTEQIVGLSDELRNLPNFEGKVIRTSNSVFGKNISDIKVGDILSDKGFLSSSKTKSKVWGDYGDYEIIINSKTGKDITKIKGKIYDKYEPEILFDRNVKFVVKNIKGNKIYIEEI